MIPVSSYLQFKAEVEKVVGPVDVVDKSKTATGVFAIAGLVGRQRNSNRVKMRENSNSPSTTRSKSVIVRGGGEPSGSEEAGKGRRRSFLLMHNPLEAKY